MIDYIIQNSATLIELTLATIGLAAVIVKLTPTQKDDAVLAKIMRVVETIAMTKNNYDDAKDSRNTDSDNK